MITKLIEDLSSDPFNPELNFNIAVQYEKMGQTASAVSFYLRTAEYGYETHPEHVYASLLKMAHCFEDQNDRQHTVSNCILQAISYLPNRKEGYFLISQFYERSSQWQECYTWASVGLAKEDNNPLPVDVGFFGDYCLEFEKAVSSWWIGRIDESIMILNKLNLKDDLNIQYKNAIKNNMKRIYPDAAI